jgi:hypothetical protein
LLDYYYYYYCYCCGGGGGGGGGGCGGGVGGGDGSSSSNGRSYIYNTPFRFCQRSIYGTEFHTAALFVIMSYKYYQKVDCYGHILLCQISRVQVHWFISNLCKKNKEKTGHRVRAVAMLFDFLQITVLIIFYLES